MERRDKIDFKILTNDPSFTAWGWAVINWNGRVLETGCIKTEPEHKKRRIRKGDDTIRRLSEINEVLLEVIKRYNIQVILSELPHGSQNASAALMIGAVTSTIQTISDTLRISVEWYSEQDSKKFCLHKKSASKEEMINFIDHNYHLDWTGIKYKDEAIADAIAIYHVAIAQSPLLKYMKVK